MHIHQVPHFDADPSSTLSRTPSIFSTESKHRPVPPSSSTSYLVLRFRPFSRFCSFELLPTRPSATLSRELRNLVAGQHFHRAGTKDRTTKRRATSENFVPTGRDLSGICSPSRFRQRLNFPALVAEILKGMSRTTAHFFAALRYVRLHFCRSGRGYFWHSFHQSTKGRKSKTKTRKSVISPLCHIPL